MPSPLAPDCYQAGYHGIRHADLLGNEEYFWARAETALKYFLPRDLDGRVFDFGCGVGQSMALVPDEEGWDISPEAVGACRRRGLRVYDRLEAVPRGVHETVLCRHVLEHVEAPLGSLRMIHTLLKPGGVLILVVPEEPRGPSPLLPDLNQHLYCWTFRTINNLLYRAGYTPVSNAMRYPLGWLAFLPIRRRLGSQVYVRLTELGRVLRRNGELVVRAVPRA